MAINLVDIGKSFRVYKNKYDRFLEWFSFGRLCLHEENWVLKNINLQINKGEVFGIVGMNGAGKSTLLKIITNTLAANTGSLSVQGKIAALLELGTGFHMELSGRENVMINGKLLGLSQEELEYKCPEIEDFCELGPYFDKPVKTYSTGMYVRLAFALATAVDPEILIIDEALSVGDAYFQQKCIKRMEKFKEKGTTIIFVSHDLGVVKLFCDRVALLQKGRLEYVGNPRDALELYNAKLSETSDVDKEQLIGIEPFNSGNGKVTIQGVHILGPKKEPVEVLQVGEKTIIQIQVKFHTQVKDPTVGIMIRDRLGYDIFGTNSSHLFENVGTFEKNELATFAFELNMDIGPGEYTLTVAVHQDRTHEGECHHWIDRVLTFKVIPIPEYQFLGVSYLKPVIHIEKTCGYES